MQPIEPFLTELVQEEIMEARKRAIVDAGKREECERITGSVGLVLGDEAEYHHFNGMSKNTSMSVQTCTNASIHTLMLASSALDTSIL
jgi:hypothetical protein